MLRFKQNFLFLIKNKKKIYKNYYINFLEVLGLCRALQGFAGFAGTVVLMVVSFWLLHHGWYC